MNLKTKKPEKLRKCFSGYPNMMSGKKITRNGKGTKSALSVAGKDWETHLTNIKKASGKDNTIKV